MKFWSELTYRKKCLYGGALAIVLLLTIYKNNISPTIELLAKNDELSKSIERAKGASQRLVNMKSKGVSLNKRLTNYMSDTTTDSQLLLGIVSQYCDDHNMKLRSFPATQTGYTDDYILRTNEVIVEGDFGELLRLLYLLETKYPVGRLASAEFEKVRDKRIRKEVLLLKMNFQKIESNEKKS